MSDYLHEVAITAIITKHGKYLISEQSEESRRKRAEPREARLYLIIRRSKNKIRFPGMWTVPGGRLETSDYLKLPKDTKEYWYNVLEKTLAREVKEEVGIEIDNVEYLTSLAAIHQDAVPSLVISCLADYKRGKVRLQPEETDGFAWVSLKDAKNYDLIDGIYDELIMADRKKVVYPAKQGKKVVWKRFGRKGGN